MFVPDDLSPDFQGQELKLCSFARNQGEGNTCLSLFIESLHAQQVGNSNAFDNQFFQSLLNHLARSIGAEFAMLWEFEDETREQAKIIATCADRHLAEKVLFRLTGTPCQETIDRGECCIPRAVGIKYPLVLAMETESYLGVSLYAATGQQFGALAILSQKPLEQPGMIIPLMRVYAHKAAQELERRRTVAGLQEQKKFFRSMFDTLPYPTFLKDLGGRYLECNASFAKYFGVSREKIIGKSAQDILPATLAGYCQASDLEYLQEGEIQRYEYGCSCADGPYREMLLKKTSLLDPDGSLVGLLGTLLDITECNQTKNALKRSEERFHSIFENAAMGIFTMTSRGKLLTVNPAFCYFLGYSEAELLSLRPRQIPHPHELPDLQLLLAEVRAGQRQTFDCEKRFLRKDGATVWGQVTANWLFDAKGTPTHAVCLVEDITQHKRVEEKVNQLAHFDPLTELPNRTLLKDRLKRALARARHQDGRGAVLFLDLDRFKGINDSLGHAAGDQLLRTAAHRLKKCVGIDDTVARLGGDEFVVILAQVPKPEDAAAVAREILKQLAAPLELEGQAISRTVSIGITLFPEDGDEVSNLLRNADLAMYQAKEQGRNNFQFYRCEEQAKIIEKLALETLLRHALTRDELFLHYQPQVETASNRLRGMETLLRWQPAGKDLIPPTKFIQVAEETGLIIPLGDWVLQKACAQNKAWQDAGLPPLLIAVNVSGIQFKQTDFVARVEAILTESGLAPQYLELELTESFIMRDVEQTRQTLQGLKRLGIQLAVDDFGIGYSSLNYLKNFPIDRLKIDQSFIRDIHHKPNDAAIIKAIIAMGHSLGMKVIAEGVETREQLDFLRLHQCDETQGFYFGRPVSKDEFTHFLQQSSMSHQFSNRTCAEARARTSSPANGSCALS
jgi:diguanylate cyclase (GGDEF)-like protein/PAS domain S-box-containing protein